MTTASAVVNGKADQLGISKATQQRVRTAIQQLDYTPSLAAREMAAGRNPLLGLAIAASAAVPPDFTATLQPLLAAAGFRVLIAYLPEDQMAAGGTSPGHADSGTCPATSRGARPASGTSSGDRTHASTRTRHGHATARHSRTGPGPSTGTHAGTACGAGATATPATASSASPGTRAGTHPRADARGGTGSHSSP